MFYRDGKEESSIKIRKLKVQDTFFCLEYIEDNLLLIMCGTFCDHIKSGLNDR